MSMSVVDDTTDEIAQLPERSPAPSAAPSPAPSAVPSAAPPGAGIVAIDADTLGELTKSSDHSHLFPFTKGIAPAPIDTAAGESGSDHGSDERSEEAADDEVTAQGAAAEGAAADGHGGGEPQKAQQPTRTSEEPDPMASVLQDIDEQLELYRIQINAVEEQRHTIQTACSQLGSGTANSQLALPASGAAQADMRKILARIEAELEHLRRVRDALILHARDLRVMPKVAFVPRQGGNHAGPHLPKQKAEGSSDRCAESLEDEKQDAICGAAKSGAL